ncbi:tetratricopeptide repeat protein [Chitinophaga agrisoli]|uniref:Tetratricopeptide repeat protein n=1 Tax=Chitinophaga agrisoli TaxID=2607653 RepID=A0A5B2VWX9_9BACT|nr:tetratricopeptide repeat protein [Chitinophaga agrisoli]KAA2243595.1 tetratricopeptide repeat protein [Chitinophaga agrisoli]
MSFTKLLLISILLQWASISLYAQEGESLMLLRRELKELRLPQVPDSSFIALKDQLNRAIKNGDGATAALSLRQMGRICYHMGHYPQGLDYYLQAAQLARAGGHKALLAENLNDIGLIYFYIRQPWLARQQLNEALAIYTALGDRSGMAVTNGKIGYLYEKQKMRDSSFFFQHQALALYEQAANREGMAKIYENIGSVFEDLDQVDSARYYFDRSLALNLQLHDSVACIEIYNNLGDLLRKTKHYREGLVQTHKALTIALAAGEQPQVCDAYLDIAKMHNLLGENDSAYHYVMLRNKIASRIYSRENVQQMALLQTMYDIEKKNDEIRHNRNTARIITVGIVVVSLLLFALGMVIISRQRLKIRNAQRINEQERRIYQTQTALMEAELENKRLQELNLKQALDVRSKELSSYTLHVIQKNQLLEELHDKLNEMLKDERRDQKKQLKQLQLQISRNFDQDQHWEEFRNTFEQVHQAFFDNIKKYSDTLTPNDMRMVALLKMNLSPNDIASLLGISQDSLRVVRYRLKKKLNLQQGESLSAFIHSL